MESRIFLSAVALVGVFAAAAPAAAQMTSATGVTFSGSATQGIGEYSINLGAAGTNGLVSQMPMSINYGEVSVTASFTGSSGIYSGNPGPTAPTAAGNYFAAMYGSVSLDFSAELKAFSLQWGSPDWTGNTLAFFNGSTLVASYTGANRQSVTGTYSNFSFAEAGFTRVVATGGVFEFANVAFGSVAPEVAPIPLNAASLGGLFSFLMMLGIRGGGARVMLLAALPAWIRRRRSVMAV